MRERNLKERTATTTNSTVNYDLPQWNGEDVTNWMTNLNDAFNKIDSAMWENHTAMAGYDKIASDLQKLADDLRVDNSEIREALGIIQRGMAQQLTELNQAKQAIENANIAITQLQQEDNVLSAMVEDLQDDIGILANYRMAARMQDVEGMAGTSVNSDGVSVNWHIHSVFIINGMLCIQLMNDTSYNISDGSSIQFIIDGDMYDRIYNWGKSVYKPFEQPHLTVPNVSVGYTNSAVFTMDANLHDGKWRFICSIKGFRDKQVANHITSNFSTMIGTLKEV